MTIRMSIARCCCVVGYTCNVLGTIYTAGLALVSHTCPPLVDETAWDDIGFADDSSDLVDNTTVVCNSNGKANSLISGNYWEAYNGSQGFSGVVSSTCRTNYNATDGDYPNEWDVCANNTVEALFTLGCIADQPNMPTHVSYDANPSVGWTATLLQDGFGVAFVSLITTMDRDANTYSSKVKVQEYTRDDDQSSGCSPTITSTDYTLASTGSSHAGSIKFKVTPIAPTYTDGIVGLTDKWKLEYTIVIGGVTVTVPDFDFTQQVRDAADNSIGKLPFKFQHGDRHSSLYGSVFKTRYTDVSAVLSNV